jgi:intracellular septation protein
MSNFINAIRPLAWDFLPTIVFAILAALHVDVTVATVCAVGVGLAELLVVKAMGRQIPLLQWAGMGLALVFGAASILTQDPRFVMAKPTIIYFAIGVVMLKRGWMVRYLPPIAKGMAEDLMIGWGYVWAGLMFATGLANGIVALEFTAQWPMFIAVAPLASKLILFAVQYVSLRTIIRARRASAGQMVTQPQAA